MREHYTFFSPLELPRETVLRTAWTVLCGSGAIPTFECEELEYDAAQQRYRWTGEFITYGTKEEVLSLTQRWRAVATYFEYTMDDVLGSLSILLWNDTSPGPTTLVLCEDSTLFNHQREHRVAWAAFQEILLSLADSLGSSFCLLKTDPPLRTMSEKETREILTLLQKNQQVPTLLAVHAGRFSTAAAVAESSSAPYSVHNHLGYIVFTDKRMGVPESD